MEHEGELLSSHGHTWMPVTRCAFPEAEPDTPYVFMNPLLVFVTMHHIWVMKMDDSLRARSFSLSRVPVGFSAQPGRAGLTLRKPPAQAARLETGSVLCLSANISSLCLQAPTAPC